MRTHGGIAGLLAAALAVGAAELAAAVGPDSRSPVGVVADAVISLTPGPVVRFAIDAFGTSNRLVLAAAMVLVMGVAAFAIGDAVARGHRWVATFGFTVVAVLGALAGLADPLVASTTAVLAPAVGAVAGIAAVTWLAGVRHAEGQADPGVTADIPPAADPGVTADTPPPADAEVTLGSSDPTAPDPPAHSRRRFLVGAVSIAGAATALGVGGRAWQGRTAVDEARVSTDLPSPRVAAGPPSSGAQLQVDGISPLVTPNDDFYRIDTAFTVPRVDPDTYRVGITGMVDRPFEVTYDELLSMADTEAYVTLSCVSNEVGGGLVGNARWLGVPLRRLLDEAGVDPDATQIVGRSVDGWTGGFPVEAAFDGRPALVAVGMNGEPLPLQHGYPSRLVISGLYGYVSDTKWLSEIELTTFEAYDAYWIPRGWARFGPIKTQSRIDVPSNGTALEAGEVVLAGVAWSDERGVSAVEVSIDEGAWQPADLADELATTSWRQWRYVWDATLGEHYIRVRASDADGTPQTSERRPPAPDGATGHHWIRVSVS